jgi:hypothetical protein
MVPELTENKGRNYKGLNTTGTTNVYY